MKFLNKNKTVLIAMSGGVDSSVSAYLLQKIGYNVEGVFIENWKYKEKCNNKYDLLDAKFISNKLNIKLHILDSSKEYWYKVFLKFLSEYKLGKTPNPDILCNKYIKFNQLIKLSKKIKARYIATGHYAKIKCINNKYFLLKPYDKEKDQTYFLYALNKKYLKYCIFPLENIKKNKVREIAKKLNFINYNKPSSTGICFINNKSFNNFIKRFIKNNYGNILTLEEKKIGYHNGLHLYTIGQRKGLNIGGNKFYKSNPWFVVKKDIINNNLYVSQNKKNLLSKGLIATYINWINYIPKTKKIELSIRIRYSINLILCNMYILNINKVLIIFKKFYDIVVPGQSVVFYIGDFCIGGGIILFSIK